MEEIARILFKVLKASHTRIAGLTNEERNEMADPHDDSGELDFLLNDVQPLVPVTVRCFSVDYINYFL
jgi:hypothetical protein